MRPVMLSAGAGLLALGIVLGALSWVGISNCQGFRCDTGPGPHCATSEGCPWAGLVVGGGFAIAGAILTVAALVVPSRDDLTAQVLDQFPH